MGLDQSFYMNDSRQLFIGLFFLSSSYTEGSGMSRIVRKMTWIADHESLLTKWYGSQIIIKILIRITDDGSYKMNRIEYLFLLNRFFWFIWSVIHKMICDPQKWSAICKDDPRSIWTEEVKNKKKQITWIINYKLCCTNLQNAARHRVATLDVLSSSTSVLKLNLT